MGASDWGPSILGAIIGASVLLGGGLFHTVWRLGRNEARLTSVEKQQAWTAEDVRYLTRNLTGTPAPSERRGEDVEPVHHQHPRYSPPHVE